MGGVVVGIIMLTIIVSIARWQASGPPPSPPPGQRRSLPKEPEAKTDPLPKKSDDEGEARKQHYVFAHLLLKNALLEDASVLRDMVEKKDAPAQTFLDLWEKARQTASGTGNKRDLVNAEPKARVLEDGVLVMMPPPKGITEARYVAALLEGDAVRYFLLEKTTTAFGGKPYVLCEWTADGKHVNLGSDAVPDEIDEDSFLAAVRTKLTTLTAS